MEIYIHPLAGCKDASDSQKRGKYLIYRPLAGLALVGNQAMATLAARIGKDSWSVDQESTKTASAVAFLSEIGFIEPDPPFPPAQATRYRSLVLLLTNICHLRCTYCYAAAGEQPPQEIAVEHARAAVDYLFERAAEDGLDQVTISFHGGGEPTLAWNLLENITRYTRSKPLKSVTSLTSNGMWSRRRCDWICANIDRLGISMDGAPETQNRQRPLASGKASARLVLRNLAEMDRRGVHYGIRMTAAAPWSQLPEDVAFVCKETGALSIQVEPAFNTGRGQHLEPPESEWRSFAAAFLQAADIARSHHRKLHYSGARAGLVTDVFCTSPYNALVVAPAGKLVACYEITSEEHPLAPISLFGKIENGQVQVDQAARENLHRLLAERRATCKDCFCYWSCAGDCYVQAFGHGEQGHTIKTARCQMNRYITEQSLLNLISKGDGYWSARTASEGQYGAQVSAMEEDLYG